LETQQKTYAKRKSRSASVSEEPYTNRHSRRIIGKTVLAASICTVFFLAATLYVFLADPFEWKDNVENHYYEQNYITEKQSIEENFDAFINKFSADETFQLDRILFPLRVSYLSPSNKPAEGYFISRDNHKHLNFSEPTDQWKIQPGKLETTVYYNCECGTIDEYIFVKNDGQWFLKRRLIDARNSKQ
jgi:hypothetical protein